MSDETDLVEEFRHWRMHARVAQSMSLAMALVLQRDGRFDISKYRSMLQAIGGYAATKEEEDVAAEIAAQTKWLEAIGEDERVDPQVALMHHLRIFLTAGPEKRDAVRSWIATATPEELADDLLDLDRELRGRAGRAGSDRQGPADSPDDDPNDA